MKIIYFMDLISFEQCGANRNEVIEMIQLFAFDGWWKIEKESVESEVKVAMEWRIKWVRVVNRYVDVLGIKGYKTCRVSK